MIIITLPLQLTDEHLGIIARAMFSVETGDSMHQVKGRYDSYTIHGRQGRLVILAPEHMKAAIIRGVEHRLAEMDAAKGPRMAPDMRESAAGIAVMVKYPRTRTIGGPDKKAHFSWTLGELRSHALFEVRPYTPSLEEHYESGDDDKFVPVKPPSSLAPWMRRAGGDNIGGHHRRTVWATTNLEIYNTVIVDLSETLVWQPAPLVVERLEPFHYAVFSKFVSTNVVPYDAKYGAGRALYYRCDLPHICMSAQPQCEIARPIYAGNDDTLTKRGFKMPMSNIELSVHYEFVKTHLSLAAPAHLPTTLVADCDCALDVLPPDEDVKVDEADLVYDRCCICFMYLYGDYYAVGDPGDVLCICALCTVGNVSLRQIGKRVMRVKHPRTALDIIRICTDPQEEQLYTELLSCNHKTDGKTLVTASFYGVTSFEDAIAYSGERKLFLFSTQIP
jgi:hypothetical protein